MVPDTAQGSKEVYQPGNMQKVSGGKSYNSTEAIKRSDDSHLVENDSIASQKRNSSLNKPQYNNLIKDSHKKLVFGQDGN